MAGDGAHEAQSAASLNRIATIPNLLSAIRILLIPAFVALLLHHRRGYEAAGLILLGGVISTDWVDGAIARRTGQVSNLGKLLDPVADRLALAAALITLAVRGVFPWWAAMLVVVRDGLILLVGAVILARYRVRIDVRWIGKVATLLLMFGIPLVAWGNFGLPLHRAAQLAGWGFFATGIAVYYVATWRYAGDIWRAVRAARRGRTTS